METSQEFIKSVAKHFDQNPEMIAETNVSKTLPITARLWMIGPTKLVTVDHLDGFDVFTTVTTYRGPEDRRHGIVEHVAKSQLGYV